MVTTTEDVCDWCYGPLTVDDLGTPLGQAFAAIDAGACATCVAARRVLQPPDSLNEAEAHLSGAAVWRLAVRSLLSGSDEEAAASDALRQVVGYEA